MKTANSTCVVRWSGGKAVLRAGKTTADDDHPLVLERPDLWDDEGPDVDLYRGVERATKAPGEKRRRGRPRLPRDEQGNIVRD